MVAVASLKRGEARPFNGTVFKQRAAAFNRMRVCLLNEPAFASFKQGEVAAIKRRAVARQTSGRAFK